MKVNLQPTVTSNLFWNFSEDRPPHPNVKVVFHGLMAFCYNRATKECEVAFHRGDLSHKLKIEVREKNKPPIYSSPDPIPQSVRIELGVDERPNDIRFYYQGSKDDFDRTNGHPQDFRWLLDFESDDGYNATLDKIRDFFTAKLYLKNGAMHTHQPTNSTFMSIGYPHGFRPLSHVAKFIAADIQLDASDKDKLYLKIDGTNVLRPGDIDPAKQYEIYFTNDCLDSGGAKCSASDFHLNFDAVDVPVPLRFALLTVFPGKDDPPPGLSISATYKPLSNDATPCMGVGFGQSDGFPG